MTYNELCAEIAALGFETETDSRERTLSAVKRALRMLFTERPLYGELVIYKPPFSPSAKIPDFIHKGGETDSIEYNARAYSFRTSGVGKYKICDSDTEKIFEFSQNSELHRGFLHGDGRIEFVGEYTYSVYDLAFFDEIYGEDCEAIPDPSGYAEYDIRSYVNDFLSFVFEPVNENGESINGSSVRGGTVRIPHTYSGKIRLIYKKAPSELLGNPDEEILLPDGCEHLLALLAASYVWLDDDAEKAQYYMSLYREAMAAVKYYDRPHIDNSYGNVNGWA